MLPPLAPFRTKPSRRATVPKRPSECRREDGDVSVKASRRPVRFERLRAAQTLKVLALNIAPRA